MELTSAAMERRRTFWRDRAGERAEEANYRALQAQLVFSILQGIFVILLIIALVSRSGGVDAAVVACEVFALAALVVRLGYRHRFFHQAGLHVGVKVSWYRPIPVREEQFKEWCRRHNMSPRTESQ